jgi:O-antigen ligase
VRAALGALALVGLSAGLVLVSPSVRARFEQSWSSEGSGERRSITQGGLNAIASAPVGGVGLGRFRPGLFLPDDAPAQAREHPGKAHDQFITLAAEAGLPAAAWLIALLVTWLVLGLRRLPGGALLVGGVTLFALLGLLHDPLFHAESSFALMLLLGAGLGALRRLQVSAGEASRTVVG